MATATLGAGTFGSGTFGDPAEHLVETFTDTAGASDAATLRMVRPVIDTAGSADTIRRSITRRAADDAGSADGALTAILRALLDNVGATDGLRLSRGQRLVEAADSAGADDAVTLVIDRRWTFSERAGTRDTVSLNGVLAGSDTFISAGSELGADRIIIRDAPLVVRTRHGGQVRDWDAANAVIADGCSVQAYSAEEQAADREFTATHKRLFAPPDTVLAATSRVIHDGATYEVDGEPAVWRDLDGRPSHVEAVLKRLSG